MSILEILKYILVVLGIVAVGAFIIWGLVSLILLIIEPHGNKEGNAKNDAQEKQITYEPQRLIAQEPVYEQYTPENEEVTEVDAQKALEEEQALNQGSTFGELSSEEEEFIKEKQRNIEERLASKAIQEETVEEELDLDSIFIDDEEEQEEKQEEAVASTEIDEDDDEDIEALINKILDGDDDELEEETNNETTEQETIQTEEPIVEEKVEEAIQPEEEPVANEEVLEQPEEVVETQENLAEEPVEEVEEKVDENAEKIRELEEQLARQKEEFEKLIAEKEAQNVALAEEKERLVKETEEKLNEKTGATLSLEEYEQRLETLKERLKNNEKDLKPVKKEFVPLSKIKARLEKDNTKLRRKEALVAKQKVVLYGVNNYVDIDEEKAKKLAEDLDLLEGLRLSVAHCEEVMKANEERYPILENSYNSLMETNAHIKADIEECNARIEEIKANLNSGEEE